MAGAAQHVYVATRAPGKFVLLTQCRSLCQRTSSNADAVPRQTDQDTNRTEASAQTHAADQKYVVYRGPWLRAFRMLVRMKIAQLTAAGAAVTPLVAWNAGEPLGALDLVGLSALFVGATAASGTLWYYSRRYVGELALVGPRVRISTLDFWGNRSDLEVLRRDIKPPFPGLTPAQLREAMKMQQIVPLEGNALWRVCMMRIILEALLTVVCHVRTLMCHVMQ